MKNFIKKAFAIVLALIMTVSLGVFVACGDEADCQHEWGKEEIIKEPTCNSAGEKTLTCLLCNETMKQSIEQLSHVYGENLINTDQEGHYYKCTLCGEKGNVTAHTLVDGEMIQLPTNDTDGLQAVSCSVCNYQGTKVIPANSHIASQEWQKDDSGHWQQCTLHSDCNQQLNFAQHSYSYKYDNDYHWQQCSVCEFSTEQTEHLWDKGTVTIEATCKQEGVRTYACQCGATRTETIPLTEEHTYGDAWVWTDGEGHYHQCTICGANDEVIAHALQLSYDDTHHFQQCSVCDYAIEKTVHVWNEGIITTKPTLTTDGEKTYTCDCGATKVEKVNAQADFVSDFTMTDGQEGVWKYGQCEYIWGDQEDFVFTQATEKNSGNDGWLLNGAEIKAGWINAEWTTIAYTYTGTESIQVDATVSFKGGTAGTLLALRIGIKNADGVIYGNPAFYKDSTSNNLNVTHNLTLNQGDTIYFMFSNEAGGVEGAYPNGELNINLVKSIAVD